MRSGDFERDVSTRVGRSDHQHIAVCQLGWPSVLTRVELCDARVELGCEVWHVRRLVATCRQHYILRLEMMITDTDHEVVVGLADRIDREATANRKIKFCGVRLKVVGHLVLGWATTPRPRKIQTRKGTEVGRGEELQRVPAFPPGIAGPLVGVQDQERLAEFGEVVAGGQAGLTAANNEGLNLLEHEPKIKGSLVARHR